MENHAMNWDPALLRKFSSTGHFRLLNQLKNDLIKRGLNRDQTTGELRMPGTGPRFGRRGGAPRGAVNGAVNNAKDSPVATPEPTAAAADPVRETPGSFRQRLNAIDMR